MWSQFEREKIADRLLEELADQSLVFFDAGQGMAAFILGRQHKVEHQFCHRDHQQILMIVPSDPVCARGDAPRVEPAHPLTSEITGEAAAFVREKGIVNAICDRIERRSHKTIAGCVEGEFLKPARHSAAAKEIAGECIQYGDPASYA